MLTTLLILTAVGLLAVMMFLFYKARKADAVDKDCYLACRKIIKSQAARIAELEGVVGMLPVTKDGKPVYPGMELWKSFGRSIESGYAQDVGAGFSHVCFPGLLSGSYHNDGFYSTREAAEAARKAEQ